MGRDRNIHTEERQRERGGTEGGRRRERGGTEGGRQREREREREGEKERGGDRDKHAITKTDRHIEKEERQAGRQAKNWRGRQKKTEKW